MTVEIISIPPYSNPLGPSKGSDPGFQTKIPFDMFLCLQAKFWIKKTNLLGNLDI